MRLRRFIACAALLLLCAVAARAAFSFPGGALGCPSSGSSPCTLSLGTAAAGDMVFAATWDNVGAPTAASDGTNTYTKVSCSGARSNMTFWYSPNVAAGTINFQITRPTGAISAGIAGLIIRGAATSSPIDAFDCTTLANNALGTVSATAAAANELVLGIVMGGGCSALTVGSGFTQQLKDTCVSLDDATLVQNELSVSGSNGSTASDGGGNFSQSIFIIKPAAATARNMPPVVAAVTVH
jgi:hypothetical protein